MYRLYNRHSGLHFYTINGNERTLLARKGWRYEGVAFVAAGFGSPVYRLYNPYDGNHLYTMNWYERNELVSKGWSIEGAAWYAPATGKPGSIASITCFQANIFIRGIGTNTSKLGMQAGIGRESLGKVGEDTCVVLDEDSCLTTIWKAMGVRG